MHQVPKVSPISTAYTLSATRSYTCKLELFGVNEHSLIHTYYMQLPMLCPWGRVGGGGEGLGGTGNGGDLNQTSQPLG